MNSYVISPLSLFENITSELREEGYEEPIYASDITPLIQDLRTRTIFCPGMILIWSGSSASIPDGWTLCDGTNNTPDLRNRFVIGAGDTYEVAATGGEATHTLTSSEMPSHTHAATTTSAGEHTHTLGADQDAAQGTYGFSIHGSSTGAESYKGSTSSAGAHTHTITVKETGGGKAHNNLPPYYALCYIMKT